MYFEIIDDKIHLNGKSIGLVTTQNPSASYPTNIFSSTHYDYKESKCERYAYFHNTIKNIDILNPNEFLEDIYLDCFDYENEDMLQGLYKKYNILKASMLFRIYYSDWDKNYSLKKFIESFRNYCKIDSRFHYTEDEFGLIIFIVVEVHTIKSVSELIEEIKSLYEKNINDIINTNKVNRSISFSPEHLRAGSSILQYFGKILQEKYPNEKVSVSIKQEGLRVTMSIETPEGKKEEIEEYLNRYGMVVTNQITPEEFTSNPIQVLELKQELREAENKIQSQKELLALKDSTYNQTLVSLQDEVKFLREELSSLRRSNDESIKIFLSSLISKDKTIKKLSKAIDKENNKETKELLLELKDKKPEEYKSLKEQIDTLIISSVANAPSWVPFLGAFFK